MAFNFLHTEIQKPKVFLHSRKLLARFSSFKLYLKQDEYTFQGAKSINCGTDYRYLALWFRPVNQTPFYLDKDNKVVDAVWDKSSKESKACYKYEFIFHQVDDITDEQMNTVQQDRKLTQLQEGKLIGCAFHPSGFFKDKNR